MKNRNARRAERFQRQGAQPITGRQTVGSFVPFDSAAAKTADGWTVLAYEVSMSESDVALTKRDFEECVANFATYPCVPVTIEHADTDFNPFAQPPREWREPNGHVEALRVGTMTRGTKTVATLEGKPSYLEPTAADVAAKKWRFGSITIIQGAVDEETGALLGSMLWSWSLTAHPRLTNIPAIAASRRPPSGATLEAGYWYGCIDDREDLVSCLREIFDLPVTSTEAEVLAELAKLEALAATDADTSGIDVDRIVGQLRDALRLPALSSTADVIAEVRKGLDTLPSEAATAATDATLSRGRAASTTESSTMFKFLPFAVALGLAAASEEEAEKKVTAFAQLGADALRALGLAPTATAADVATKVSTLAADAAKLPALQTELTAFRAEQTKRVAADRAAYLDDLVAARPELAPVRASLALHADNDFAGFSTAYPRPTREVLITAAAEAAQRAQDGGRTTAVTTASATTKDAPKALDTGKHDRKGLAEVLAEFGHPTDAATIAGVIAQGHTPATLRAALAA